MIARKAVGRNIFHTWYNEEEDKDELYNGKIVEVVQGAVATRIMKRAREGKRVMIKKYKQFCSSFKGDNEQRIVERLTSKDPTLRCVISTIALGMGMNLKGIEQSHSLGCPRKPSAVLARSWQRWGKWWSGKS